jgi:replicative DNA helicase
MSKTFSYRLHQLLDNDDQDEKLLYDRIKDLLGQYEQDDELHDGTASIGELYRNFIERTGEFDQSQAITCDFEELDEQRVFQKGEFVVIGGRPAMGKSQLMINIAMNMSVRVPVLYISFDQSKLSLTRRMISSLTELDFSRIRQGHLNELQLKLVRGVDKEFVDRKLFINDTSNSSVRSVRDMCRLHIEKDGVQVIFVDYLQLLSAQRYRNHREMEVAYICRTLKQLARENNVLVIAASQLSRSVETRGGDKRPVLSDLRESGAIEQDADKVFFVYRPEYYGFTIDEMGNSNRGMCELIMAKNRSGHPYNFRFKWNDNFTRMMTLADHLDQFRIDHDRLEDLNNLNPF